MSMVDVLQRSVGRPVGRLLMVLSMSGLMFYGMVSCKRPHSSAAPEEQPQQQAVTNSSAGAPDAGSRCKNGVEASNDLTVKVNCTGFKEGSSSVCGLPGGSVKFKTTCTDKDVKVSFTHSGTLFDPAVKQVTLLADGGSVSLTIKSGNVTAKHCMCVDTDPSECSCKHKDENPSTGSLDVSTTTQPPDAGPIPI